MSFSAGRAAMRSSCFRFTRRATNAVISHPNCDRSVENGWKNEAISECFKSLSQPMGACPSEPPNPLPPRSHSLRGRAAPQLAVGPRFPRLELRTFPSAGLPSVPETVGRFILLRGRASCSRRLVRKVPTGAGLRRNHPRFNPRELQHRRAPARIPSSRVAQAGGPVAFERVCEENP